jgi:hypothetical protein
MSTVTVTADIRDPLTDTPTASGSVAFQLVRATAEGSIIYGDEPTGVVDVVAGAFADTVTLTAEADWIITVQTPVWRERFQVHVPATPSTTTLGTLHDLAAPAPASPALFVPLSSVGQPGGPAGPLGADGSLPAGQSGAARPYELAKARAVFPFAAGELTPHPDNDPDNAITLTDGETWDKTHFVCSELIVLGNDVTVTNSHVECGNADFGVRLDANTGLEHGRVFSQCKITALGRAFSGGSGVTIRLCEITQHGDDAFQFGRTYTQGPVLEYCYVHDTRPAAGAHADGLQQLAPPAADVHLYGCYLDLSVDPDYTLPGDAGFTGALFADPDDTGIPEGDPDPNRVGWVFANGCFFKSPQNYSVVLGAHAKVSLVECAIAKGTTDYANIDAAATVIGYGNTDDAGVPLSISSLTAFREPVLGDLTDVDPTGVTDQQVLAFDAAASRWVPATPSGGGSGDGIPLSTVTTVGDLVVGTGAGTVSRFPVGTPGQVIMANSGADIGMSWEDAPSGGGGAAMSIASGFIVTGNVGAVNTGGAYLPIAGTEESISAVAGDQVSAEYGFTVLSGAGTYYDIGVVDTDGNLVRQLGSPSFPAPGTYEGMGGVNPDGNIAGCNARQWFTVADGDLVDGAVRFCLCWRSGGSGTFLANTDVPVSYSLYNNHQ